MKNKMARLVLILLAVAVICLSVGTVILLANNGAGDRFAEEQNVNKELLFNSGEVRSLKIECVSNTIRFHEAETDTIRFHLTGSHAGPDDDLLTLESELKNGELVVRVKRKPVVMSFFYYESVGLDIYLPKMAFKHLDIETTSADLDAQFLRASEFSYQTTSGSIHIGTLEADKTEIETVSGDAIINTITGGLQFESVSGQINARFEALTDDITMATTSGSARITLPADSEFQLDTSSVSGSVFCDFPLLGKYRDQNDREWSAVVGSGGVKITWESISGDLELLTR